MKKICDLCQRHPARMYCESDEASLCWDCDAKVHAANFLVARHSRSLLCHCCQSTTPWTASGANLGPTFSVCRDCVASRAKSGAVRGGDLEMVNESRADDNDALEEDDHGGEDVEDEVEEDLEDEESDNDADDEEDEGEEEEEEEEEEEGEEDGDNQVVPWSASPPPPASPSTSENSFRQTSETSIIRTSTKRIRKDPEVSWQNDVDSLSLQPVSSAGDDEATSVGPFQHKRRLLLPSPSTAGRPEPCLRNFWGEETRAWSQGSTSTPYDVVHLVSATTSGSGDRPV